MHGTSPGWGCDLTERMYKLLSSRPDTQLMLTILGFARQIYIEVSGHQHKILVSVLVVGVGGAGSTRWQHGFRQGMKLPPAPSQVQG